MPLLPVTPRPFAPSANLAAGAGARGVPRQGEEVVPNAWVLLPPRGMPPHPGATLPDPLPRARPCKCPLGQPAGWFGLGKPYRAPLLWPCFLGLAPLLGAELCSRRTWSQLSACLDRASRRGGAKGLRSSPCPSTCPWLPSCRSLLSDLLLQPFLLLCPLPSLTLHLLLLQLFFFPL